MITIIPISLFACNKISSTEELTQYYLSLKPNNMQVDPLIVGGGNYDGEILISINGVPVILRRGGGVLSHINKWLNTGRNDISIKGSCKVELRLIIFELKANWTAGKEYVNIIIKENADAEKYNFDINDKNVGNLPIENIIQRNESVKLQEKQFVDLLSEFEKYITDNAYEEILSLYKYDLEFRNINKSTFKQSIIKLKDNGLNMQVDKTWKLKYDDNGILAYKDWWIHQPYAFTYSNNTKYTDHIIIIKIKNKLYLMGVI
jgi:hypothetical protein